jgi:septal ring factor EnvC (AmiA/AmiB activator)
MGWEAVAGLAGGTIAVLTAIGFIASLIAGGVEKGRQEQRIDNLETRLKEQERRLQANDRDHNEATVTLTRQDSALAEIKVQIDRIVVTQEKMMQAITDLAMRMPR